MHIDTRVPRKILIHVHVYKGILILCTFMFNGCGGLITGGDDVSSTVELFSAKLSSGTNNVCKIKI